MPWWNRRSFVGGGFGWLNCSFLFSLGGFRSSTAWWRMGRDLDEGFMGWGQSRLATAFSPRGGLQMWVICTLRVGRNRGKGCKWDWLIVQGFCRDSCARSVHKTVVYDVWKVQRDLGDSEDYSKWKVCDMSLNMRPMLMRSYPALQTSPSSSRTCLFQPQPVSRCPIWIWMWGSIHHKPIM